MGQAMVIGGSRGLGRAIVTELLERGEVVYVVARHNGDLPPNVRFIQCDLQREDAAEKYLVLHHPTTLYLCAAAGFYGSPERLTMADISRVIKVTFQSSIDWIAAGLCNLDPGAQIAWISSLSALIPDEKWALYSSCKAGVEHFIAAMRPYATRRGIGITVCYPGQLLTGFHASAGANTPPKAASPKAVATPLVDAVMTRSVRWVAPMDAEIINALDELPRARAPELGQRLE